MTLSILLGVFAVSMLAWGVLPGLLDPTFERHIQDKDVIVGMTREQAMQAWGSPYQMNVTYTDRGVRREESMKTGLTRDPSNTAICILKKASWWGGGNNPGLSPQGVSVICTRRSRSPPPLTTSTRFHSRI